MQTESGRQDKWIKFRVYRDRRNCAGTLAELILASLATTRHSLDEK